MNNTKNGQVILLLVLSLINFLLLSFIMSKGIRLYPLEKRFDRTALKSFTKDVCQDKDMMEEPIVNPFPYNFRLNQEKKCFKTKIGMVLAVPSSRAEFEKRREVRESWGTYTKYPSVNGVVLFFIGNGGHSESLDIQEKINEESQKYADIIQSDFVDSYRNLTLKSVSILKWFSTYCRHAEFLIKADSSLYINVPKLYEWLNFTQKEINLKSFILGLPRVGKFAVRDNKSELYTPEEDFADNIYPLHVLGTAYSMSRDAALALFQAAMRTPFFWLEDVFITGLCAKKAKVTIIKNSKQTDRTLPPSVCIFRYQIFIGQLHRISVFHQTMLMDWPSLKC